MRMSGPLAGHERPRANRGRRLRTAGRDHGVGRERQRGAQDERVVRGLAGSRRVVARATALLRKAERAVERPGGLVLLVHFEGDRGGTEHLRVVGNAGHKARGDALAPARRVHDDLLDLKVRPREQATRKADDRPLVVRDPPAASGLGELLVEHLLSPRRVRRGLVGGSLERGHGGGVVHRHGTKLQVDARERVIDAGELHGRRLLEAQAGALGLLGVGEARVDGQDQRRVAGLFVKDPSLDGRAQQSLARGVPRLLGREGREARGLKARTVLDQAVARERELGRVGATCPRSHAGVGLRHGLGREGAVRARLVELVDAGVHLAAHGVARHGERAARAGVPRRPRHRIERGGSKERKPRAAREALGRGDADAHTRERAGAAPHEHGVEVVHRKAGLRERPLRRGHQLHVGLASAQMVARGQHRHGTVRAHAPDGTGQHVRGRVQRKDGLLGRDRGSGVLLAHCGSSRSVVQPIQCSHSDRHAHDPEFARANLRTKSPYSIVFPVGARRTRGACSCKRERRKTGRRPMRAAAPSRQAGVPNKPDVSGASCGT